MFKFWDDVRVLWLMWVTRNTLYQPEPVPAPAKPNLPRVHSGSGYAL